MNLNFQIQHSHIQSDFLLICQDEDVMTEDKADDLL